MTQSKIQLYSELFLSTLKLSASTFGGGYVIVPLMRQRFVNQLKWIDESEMLDIIAVSQSSPGPIAVNCSLMVGYRMAGILGAIITTLGTVLPPLIIISVISLFYKAFRDNTWVNAAMEGMQAGVAAVIVSVVMDMGSKVMEKQSLLSAIIMALVFTAVYFFKVNVILVIILCALTGILFKAKDKSKGDKQCS